MMSLRKPFLALSLLSLVNLAQAAIIELNGDHFSVTYDNAQTGLYQQGNLSGSLDTVYFQPSTFAAISGGVQASTQASLQLTFTIDPGYVLTGINVTERGDYFLFGDAAVSVVVGAQTDTAAIVPLSLDSGLSLNQTGGSTAWELTGNLASQGLVVPQTLQVTLDNTVFASASAGSLGFIQKTYAGFRVMTQPVAVPEPSSWALLLAGIMAALLAGRRRVSSHAMRV